MQHRRRRRIADEDRRRSIADLFHDPPIRCRVETYLGSELRRSRSRASHRTKVREIRMPQQRTTSEKLSLVLCRTNTATGGLAAMRLGG